MERHEYLAKLLALRRAVANWEELRRATPPIKGLPLSRVLDLFERFAGLRADLRTDYPQLFKDLPGRPIPRAPLVGPPSINETELESLLRDVVYCHDVLSNLPAADVPALKVSREGVFFAGEYFDALRKAADILARAALDVCLIDGYVDSSVLDLFAAKRPGVTVRILTKTVSPDLKVTAEAFNKQYGGLLLKTSASFHDRFVVVDDSEFYHFGASLKDLGHRGFMFSRIEEPDVIEPLRSKIKSEWSNGTVVV